MKLPDFTYEKPLWEKNYSVIGIDEVGRGAFAGPVGIGGVVFEKITNKDQEYLLSLGINDSKKLTPKKRLEISVVLKQICTYSVEYIDVKTINNIGIGKATFLGMERVVDSLCCKLPTTKLFSLIDAFKVPGLKIPQKGIVRGDSLSISIAAASIIAKVERDRLMEELDLQFRNYGFDKNKGYGTKYHRTALKEFGSTIHHRNDFVAAYI
mgnify:CR=1 FL=1